MINYFEVELIKYKNITILNVQRDEMNFIGKFHTVKIFGKIKKTKDEIETQIDFSLNKGKSIFKKKAVNRIPLKFLKNKEIISDRVKDFFMILLENISKISLDMLDESYLMDKNI